MSSTPRRFLHARARAKHCIDRQNIVIGKLGVVGSNMFCQQNWETAVNNQQRGTAIRAITLLCQLLLRLKFKSAPVKFFFCLDQRQLEKCKLVLLKNPDFKKNSLFVCLVGFETWLLNLLNPFLLSPLLIPLTYHILRIHLPEHILSADSQKQQVARWKGRKRLNEREVPSCV